jgi:hypothetical protein
MRLFPLAVAGALACASALASAPAASAGSTQAHATYFVAPGGSDSAAGTRDHPWATIARAQDAAQPGDTVYLRGGTYTFTSAAVPCTSQTDRVNAVDLSKSGTDHHPIRYWAFANEKPVFDFSRMTDDCRIKGFNVTGSWLHLRGLEVKGVPQNNNLNHESWGLWISGSHNIFERIDTHHNMGPGLFIQDGGDNLVLNSDSHDNYDPLSSSGPGTNADGFGAHIPAGNPGNVFRGCRAWWNTDDGFDLINAYSSVSIKNSWAWRNGYLPETTTAAGDGNGFKAGGYGGDYDAAAVKHRVVSSVAFLNRASGFYANHHPLANDFFNDTSYDNRWDFNMLGVSPTGDPISVGVLRNNVAYGGTLLSNVDGADAAYNSWNTGVTMSDDQFRSVSTTGWDAPRAADGALPNLPYLHLNPKSPLVDAGVDVGLPYAGAAPDLGAFEVHDHHH